MKKVKKTIEEMRFLHFGLCFLKKLIVVQKDMKTKKNRKPLKYFLFFGIFGLLSN
jgi:hypothetical protein